jgi:hypothetical protein
MEINMAKVLAFESEKTGPSDNILRKVPGRPKNGEVHMISPQHSRTSDNKTGVIITQVSAFVR